MTASRWFRRVVVCAFAAVCATGAWAKAVDEFAVAKPGAVKPTGWLREWAQAAAKGATGRMEEVDEEFRKAWAADFTPRGKNLNWFNGTWSCEGGAYWFDGLVRLAYQLDDPELKALARRRLDPVLDRMTETPIGFCWWLDRRQPAHFDEVFASSDWMVNWVAGMFARPISAWFSASGDPRAARALDCALGDPYWNRGFSRSRDVASVPGSVITIPSGTMEACRATGSAKVAAALETYARDYAAHPTRETYGRPPFRGIEETMNLKRREQQGLKIPLRHGVVTHESLLSLFTSARVTGDAALMRSWTEWMKLLDTRARLPYGATVMDEEWGHPGPRRGTETCALAAELWARIHYLTALGEAGFADDVERGFFNAVPAAVTRDWRAHVYFQTPNRLAAGDSGRLSVWHQGAGARRQVNYEAKHDPLCCTAGLNRLVPEYVQAMWMTTADGGVAAALYGPCTFETELAGGRFAAEERTDYPFDETVEIAVTAAPGGAFPLAVRVPGWCGSRAEISVNGEPAKGLDGAGFVRLVRTWKAGDAVRLRFPMAVRVETAVDADETHETFASVLAGPLLFAKGFAEKSANEPAEKTFVPVLDTASAAAAQLTRKPLARPWNWPLDAPVKVTVRDAAGAPLELVPYGCTKFRASMLRTAGESGAADMVLADGWRVVSDVRHEGLTNGWATAEPAGTVPAAMPFDGRAVKPFSTDVWLYRDFVASPSLGPRASLELGGQQYLTTAWLNGRKLGEHRGSFDRFAFDVSGVLRLGETNRLVMNLRSAAKGFEVDGNGWHGLPVWSSKTFVQKVPVLMSRGPVALADVATHADPKSGRLALDVELDAATAGPVELVCEVHEKGSSALVLSARQTVAAAAGRSVAHVDFAAPVPNFRTWSPDDPAYYLVTVRLPGEEVVAKAAFRELRVDGSGYFELNGRRIFVKSAHMCNYLPFASDIPVQLPRIYQTLLYLKTCGFNAVRYLMQPAHPEVLDLCDDIGLMVYEEHAMSWLKKAGRNAKGLFRESVTQAVRRDRNHPSLAAFGLMNETEAVPEKVPFLDAARDLLPELRSLDRDVLFLYGSGRWDQRFSQASAANPFSSAWDGWMGDEGPDAPSPTAKPNFGLGDGLYGLGDIHLYPAHPLGSATRKLFDRYLHGRKRGVFVSESGMGSSVNVIHEYLRYDQDGVFRDGDYDLAKRQVGALRAAFRDYGLHSCWATPESMIQESQDYSARQRDRLTTMIRRHPEACGYSVTMAQDMGLMGEGLLETSGSFKRGMSEVLEEAMSDLRFCITFSDEAVYAGSDLAVEVKLSDFGVLKTGRDYPIALRMTGPQGVVWQKELSFRPKLGMDGHPAPVSDLLVGRIPTKGWAPGRYRFGAEMLEGAHAECGAQDLTLVDPQAFAALKGRTVTVVGDVSPQVTGFCQRVQAALTAADFGKLPADATVLVGSRPPSDDQIAKLVAAANAGATVVFLDAKAIYGAGSPPCRGLPIKALGKCRRTNNWLYHADTAVLPSALTDGVPRGIFDEQFFGGVWSDFGLHGITPPDVPGMVSAYIGKGGSPKEVDCETAVQLGAWKTGRGWIVLSTLNLSSAAGTPGADLLLRNLLAFSGDSR